MSLKRQLSKKFLKKQKSHIGGDDVDSVGPSSVVLEPTMNKFNVFGDPVDVLKFNLRDYGTEAEDCSLSMQKLGMSLAFEVVIITKYVYLDININYCR